MADPLAESLASLCGALCGLRDQVQALSTVHAAVDEFNGVFGAFQNAMALHASCLAFPAPPKPAPAPPPPRVSTTGIPKPQIAAPSVSARSRAPSSSGSAGRASDASGGAQPAVAVVKPAAATKKRPSGGPSGAPSGPPGGAKKKAPPSAATTKAIATAAAKKKKPSVAKSRAAAAAAAAQAMKNARPETAPWKWDKNVRDAIPRKYQSEGELAKLENVLIYLKNRQGGVTIADLVKHSGLAVIRCKEILQTLTKINLIARTQESAGFLYTFGPPEEP